MSEAIHNLNEYQKTNYPIFVDMVGYTSLTHHIYLISFFEIALGLAIAYAKFSLI